MVMRYCLPLVTALVLGFLGPAIADTTAPRQAPAICQPGDQLSCTCDAAPESILNDLVMPCFLGDVNREVFRQTDPFANNAFAALNWPKAAGRGEPDVQTTPTGAARASPSGDFVTVWESWPDTRALLPRDGSAPKAWVDAAAPLPAACRALQPDAEKARYADAQVPEGSPVRLLDDYVNPDGDGLIDASGQPVRYEVLFNRQAYDYVFTNDFWNRSRLDAFIEAKGAIAFPEGHWASDATSRGAIVIKAAWKVLDLERDDPQHFHKSWAYVTPVVRDGVAQPGTCELRPVALVAMHVALKTTLLHDWLWSTFEHIAIAPGWDQFTAVENNLMPPYDGGDPARSDWLFYAPLRAACMSCKPAAALNDGSMVTEGTMARLPSRILAAQPRGYYFESDDEKSNGQGSDGDDTRPGKGTFSDVVLKSYADMDALMAQGFAGSPIRFYRLKGAQWVDPRGLHHNKPEILANTALEAFSQSTSSCVACHAQSGTPKVDPATGAPVPHPYDYIFALEQKGIAATVDPLSAPAP